MQTRFFVGLILSILFISSCQKNDPTLQDQLDAGTTPAELLNDYPVDSFYTKEYAGGLIFHLESDGTGMVVAKEDLSANAWWGCAGNEIMGAEGVTIGTGKTNTDDILAECGDFTAAAGLCFHWTSAAYTDWYLPSEDELEVVYTNVHLNGAGNFAANFYWTSTENPGTNTAQHVLFDDGSVNFSTKTNSHYVRAVRNF